VLDSVEKEWGKKREDALNHVLVAVVLFVIVVSTVNLLLPNAIAVPLHAGSASR
jgi:nitrogen fixation protein FixH